MNIILAVVAGNGGMAIDRESMFPNQFWDWGETDPRLYIIPYDLISMDLMLMGYLEYAFSDVQ